MGYDIHITRAQFWHESDTAPIFRDEWGQYVARDPQIEQDPQNLEDDFLYIAHSSGGMPLWWWDGKIYCKNPDEEMIAKMCEIAANLEANVQGDGHERYCE